MTVEQKFEALDQFPVGMRILAVDDDQTCLKILETLLRHCQYHVTTTNQAQKGLELLREKKNKFDLVISDVDMPDMDGFKLLELVGLEMDLPVIMLSAHSDPKYVMKGVTHGACDYLLKPVRIEELKNIWQHVVRCRFDKNRGSNNGDKRDEGAEVNNVGFNRKRKDQYNEDEDEDNDDPTALKKQRVVWTVDLHKKFVAAVNQLGYEKAMPKKILDLMNVENLTRENVASHLQKFRLYLKRISGVTNQQSLMANSDLHFLQMSSSLSGLEAFHHRQIHGSVRPNSSNGILGRLNTPSGIRNFSSPSGMYMQNPTNLGKFHHVSSLSLNHSDGGGNIVQGLAMPLEFDQLQSNNNTRNMNNNKSIAERYMAFASFSAQQNSLGVVEGRPQACPPGFPGQQINNQFEDPFEWNNVTSGYSVPICDPASTPASDTTNLRPFCRNIEFDSNPNAQPGGFYNTLQIRQSGNYGPATNVILSSNPKEVFDVRQHKLQSVGFRGSDPGSLDDIVNSTTNEQSQGDLLGGDVGYGGFSALGTCL